MFLDFRKFVRDVLDALTYSAFETEFLRELRFAGGKYSDFARILQNNRGIEDSLLKIANTAFETRLKEPLNSVEVALSMIGFLPARNLLAASMLRGNVANLIPGDGSITHALKYAQWGEQEGARKGLSSADLYLAGLVFDILTAVILPPNPDGTRADAPPLFDELWKHGFQVANTACQLSKKLVPAMNLEKDLCLDGVLHDIGKLILYPKDHELRPSREIRIDKNDPPLAPGEPPRREKLGTIPDAIWIEENKTCGLPHDVIGHLILWRLGFLHDSSWIIMYHHQPFLAARLGKVAQARAGFIWLADHICHYREFHRVARPGERMMTRWFNGFKPCVKGSTYEQVREAILTLSPGKEQ